MGRLIAVLPADEEILERLAANPRDGEALVALYENHEKRLKRAVTRWFGREAGIRNSAINSILVSIARQAAAYDPQSMEPAAWLSRLADAEARRLRKAWDTPNSKSFRGRRSM